MGTDYRVTYSLKVQGLDTKFAEALKVAGFFQKDSGNWFITSTDPSAAFDGVVKALGNPTVEALFVPLRGGNPIPYRNYPL